MANTINERVFGVLECLSNGPRNLSTTGLIRQPHITIAMQAGWIRPSPNVYALTKRGGKALASLNHHQGTSRD